MRLFVLTAALMLSAIAPAHAVLEDYPSIKLQGLDKSVGRTVTFEAKVGSTIQYGPLYIKIHACRKAPPIEAPESAAFLQIWEIPPGGTESEWVFSGWMFASSPALSAMDHPVYDVWVIDCTGREEPNEEAAAAQSDEEADQTSLPAADGAAPAAEEIPVDSEAAPEDVVTPQVPEQEQQPVIDESLIPLDGEAQIQDPVDAQPQGALPSSIEPPQAAPPVYENPYDAPYSPSQYPQGQQPPPQAVPAPAPAPASPHNEGIYSPSQGRIVPAPQPLNPYGQY